MDRIRWLFFDLGSTLVDETDVYKERIGFALAHADVSRDEFMKKVKALAAVSPTAIKTAAEFYGVTLPPWNNSLERLYPDAEYALKALSEKYSLGVIANQTLGAADRLENWGVGRYFDVIASSEEEGCAKPDPELFRIALGRAGCGTSEAMMIGDRLDNDIAPARMLGMKTVWIRQLDLVRLQKITGGETRPDFTVESLRELTELLTQLK